MIIQIPKPVSLVADEKIAEPRTPNVVSMARNMKTPAKIDDQDAPGLATP
jgi:hypothetical protein